MKLVVEYNPKQKLGKYKITIKKASSIKDKLIIYRNNLDVDELFLQSEQEFINNNTF